MQANVEGGLSERARKRALELANDADLRISPPKGRETDYKVAIDRIKGKKNPHNKHNLTPGMILNRKYKDKMISVIVREKGFEYEGKVYRSLTAIADEVTGSHWNGYVFFKNAFQDKKELKDENKR